MSTNCINDMWNKSLALQAQKSEQFEYHKLEVQTSIKWKLHLNSTKHVGCWL